MNIRTKKQMAYDYIRENILCGKYPGQFRLREKHIAEEIEVSRGPLREAISELVSEGLLEKVPGLGVYVRQSSIGEIIELYEIREALEGFAAGKSAQNISTDDLVELDGICNAMHRIAREFQACPSKETARDQRSHWLELDLRFHEKIIHLAKNNRLESILETSRVMSQTFREKHVDPTISDARVYLSNLAWAWRDHVRILQAMQQRNPGLSRQSMVVHIRRAKQRSMRIIEALNPSASS